MCASGDYGDVFSIYILGKKQINQRSVPEEKLSALLQKNLTAGATERPAHDNLLQKVLLLLFLTHACPVLFGSFRYLGSSGMPGYPPRS